MPLFPARLVFRLAALAAVALLLAACGQTGPLHLPEDAPAKENYLLKKRADKPATLAATPAPPSSPAADPVPADAAVPAPSVPSVPSVPSP